jgi:putative membrane protein
MPYYPMMEWYPLMGFWMNLIWLIVIFAIAYFIYKQIKSGKIIESGKSAEDLLAERYAKGELTREQYMQMKEDIKKSSS